MSDLFLLNAGLFPFSLPAMLWDTCISEYLHKDSNLEVSSNRGDFEKIYHKLTHHPYLDGYLGQSGTRYRPQFYKVGLLPSPHIHPRLGKNKCNHGLQGSCEFTSQNTQTLRFWQNTRLFWFLTGAVWEDHHDESLQGEYIYICVYIHVYIYVYISIFIHVRV